ncbi:MAG TPA: MOSC domain-containing protein [Rubrobacteraceae bacterium]|nr:MOSC domain-containing protein [Rubrobacteraceae bacterium]
MVPDSAPGEREALSLTRCVAYVLDVDPSEVPGDGGVGLRQWLALWNLGLVPVESPEDFAWPGRFLGRRRGSRTWAVLFGVPPGVVFDPAPDAAGSEDVDAAFVLAAHDPGRQIGLDQPVRPSKTGVVELISVSEEAEGPMLSVTSAEALAGRGLRGDRYARGAGTFSDPDGRGYDLTLVEAEALEELAASGVEIEPAEARRNLVVRSIALDDLIGKRFRVGGVECFGQRRCEPCAHLEKLTRPGVLRGLVHRGGLRADVLSDGEIRTGDRVEALS